MQGIYRKMKSINRVNVSPDNGFLSLKVFGIVWYFSLNAKCIFVRNCFGMKTALVQPLVVSLIFKWFANVLFSKRIFVTSFSNRSYRRKLSAISSGLH